jgi:hypothetical protein
VVGTFARESALAFWVASLSAFLLHEVNTARTNMIDKKFFMVVIELMIV